MTDESDLGEALLATHSFDDISTWTTEMLDDLAIYAAAAQGYRLVDRSDSNATHGANTEEEMLDAVIV